MGYKGSLLLYLHFHDIFISINITHHQHILPYQTSSTYPTQNREYFSDLSHKLDPIPLDPHTRSLPAPSTQSNNQQNYESPPHTIRIPDCPPVNHNPITCVSSRVRHQPMHLKDYVCASFNDIPNQFSSGTSYPISNFLTYSNISPSQYCFSLSLTIHTEPNTFNEASKFEYWNQAMKVELDALKDTGTWELVDLPSNLKPIFF